MPAGESWFVEAPEQMRLPSSISSHLRLPLMAAPMLHVSGPELVSAACRSGVIGAFPTPNARTADQLDRWLTQIEDDCARAERPCAPVCANVIMRSSPDLLEADLAVLLKHRVPLVLASVGSPKSIIAPLHDVGSSSLTVSGPRREPSLWSVDAIDASEASATDMLDGAAKAWPKRI